VGTPLDYEESKKVELVYRLLNPLSFAAGHWGKGIAVEQ
jgi:hypothetical protein